ncbi:MAG: hypothetical protein HFE73_04965 [Firmicutes bacterium]|nr:hypothetical protein [Bacillota bacterium]
MENDMQAQNKNNYYTLLFDSAYDTRGKGITVRVPLGISLFADDIGFYSNTTATDAFQWDAYGDDLFNTPFTVCFNGKPTDDYEVDNRPYYDKYGLVQDGILYQINENSKLLLDYGKKDRPMKQIKICYQASREARSYWETVLEPWKQFYMKEIPGLPIDEAYDKVKDFFAARLEDAEKNYSEITNAAAFWSSKIEELTDASILNTENYYENIYYQMITEHSDTYGTVYTFLFETDWPAVEAPTTPGGGIPMPLPPAEKPTVTTDEYARVEISEDGTSAKIFVSEGYEIADVMVNGVSKGAVTQLTGLKSSDKIQVVTKPIDEGVDANEDKEMTAAKAEMAKVNSKNFAARSRVITVKSGKKAVKITWKNTSGIEFDGVEIFRSTKKNSGFGKKPIYTTKKSSYTNTKVSSGRTYYYKIRGYRVVNGKKIYTGWSSKAWRRV